VLSAAAPSSSPRDTERAMSQPNVEIVRAVYEALRRNDIEGALDLMSTDFELDYSRSRGPESGVFRGRDRVKEGSSRGCSNHSPTTSRLKPE
jgi:ketosteroid isomerase-like protein